jgi:two-component system response regulator (stage 0 sporulation protein F)
MKNMSEPITLLYVDDEPINLMLFAVVFKKKFTILTAESGLAGLELLRQHSSIKAVISDMRMPEMNGLEFIRKAKAEYPMLCYFILTGFDLTDEIMKAINEGLILKFFRKPFESKDIEESVLKAVE